MQFLQCKFAMRLIAVLEQFDSSLRAVSDEFVAAPKQTGFRFVVSC